MHFKIMWPFSILYVAEQWKSTIIFQDYLLAPLKVPCYLFTSLHCIMRVTSQDTSIISHYTVFRESETEKWVSARNQINNVPHISAQASESTWTLLVIWPQSLPDRDSERRLTHHTRAEQNEKSCPPHLLTMIWLQTPVLKTMWSKIQVKVEPITILNLLTGANRRPARSPARSPARRPARRPVIHWHHICLCPSVGSEG